MQLQTTVLLLILVASLGLLLLAEGQEFGGYVDAILAK